MLTHVQQQSVSFTNSTLQKKDAMFLKSIFVRYQYSKISTMPLVFIHFS